MGSIEIVFLILQRATRWEKVRDTNLTRPHAVEPVLRFCSELVPRNVAEKHTFGCLNILVESGNFEICIQIHLHSQEFYAHPP